MQTGSHLLPLADVQLITRFCRIEAPYWSSFLNHYSSFGVECIHVCVQSNADAKAVEAAALPDGFRCQLHRLPPELPPDQALKQLPLKALADGAAYTLLADGDEYLTPLRSDVGVAQLFALFPDVKQLFIPWLMAPFLDGGQPPQRGYWGHIGKPLVRSERMAAIACDHGFLVDEIQANRRFGSAPAGVFGWAIAHYWARGFRECLLKTFHNRFNDAKSVDRFEALDLIRAGELPIRLRLLAFLMLQQGYVPLPSWQEQWIDRDLEAQLLRRVLSEDEERRCRCSFDRYQQLLRDQLPHLPLYPAASLLTLAQLLPSLAELEAAET
ncbi:hypothetical protein CWE17_07055 [Synechococcus sp. BS56D]|uniref:hypothetical protein n=1 Tax=Synechococcus sp. BS56D TaxID=2055944 RepID=UPI001039B9A1|nr:hypothetical protein [Synechococcus sp. BS56D]TCD57595.1 hypothetical protein CWE17_07055 [Synechococcus sp. BS56D]